MATKTIEGLWRWSGEGELPIVIDATSCTQGLVDDAPAGLDERGRELHAKLELLDSIAWAERLLPRLEVSRKVGAAAVHPTCSARHLELDRALAAIAGELAEEVYVPPSASCCGFAGDRGFLHPELTEAATRDEADELEGREFDAYLCSNRTCEMGLERAIGKPYASFVYLLEALTRGRDGVGPPRE
jgi:D-lactate dehydrogenase